MKLILASNSPRRKEFLTKYGFEFEVISSPYQERNFTDDPYILTKEFALGKAQSVFDKLDNKDDYLVLGADTVVYFDGKILGKPKDKLDAKKMLTNLSGKSHLVISGFAIVSKNSTVVDADLSYVTFNNLNSQLIDDYVNSGLPLDKAGSYGIQDGFNIVKQVDGSYDNVVGLPTEKILPILKDFLSK